MPSTGRPGLEYHSEHDHAGARDAGSTDGRKHGSGNNNALSANGEVDSEYLGNKDGANALVNSGAVHVDGSAQGAARSWKLRCERPAS